MNRPFWTAPLGPGLSPNQLKKLNRPPDASRIRIRQIDGKKLSCIDGWYAIAQANEIFGITGWDRQTIHCEKIHESERSAETVCGYLAKVRIRVRANGTSVLREGTGSGWASARLPSEAHECALKAAETDATKRALATLGQRFGLGLYENGRSGRDRENQGFALLSPNGLPLCDHLSPEGFASGLRQLIEACTSADDIDGLAKANAKSVLDLKRKSPTLCNGRGIHFSDLLRDLIGRRQSQLREGQKPADEAPLA